jgi:16S rRNA processing protein RimM
MKKQTQNSSNSTPEFIHFAYIGRPHGLKGAFFLKTDDRRLNWDGYQTVYLKKENQYIPYKVKKNYISGKALVIECDGLSSRENIEPLYDQKLYISKDEIVLNEDEYLVHDLLNYKVCAKDKGVLGEVISVVSYGAQENLEIKIPDRSSTVLYPFIDKFIHNIDSQNRTIEVEYIEEFFLP